MSASALETLGQAVPGLQLKTAPADLEHYGRDWTRRWSPAPLAIALPASVEQVQALVRWANDSRTALVPSGGRTGLSGGAVAANGELVVSLERMNRVLGFEAVDRTLTVEAGAVLQAVQDAIANPKKLKAARGFLSGQVMKLSGGRADPRLAGELIEQRLAEIAAGR